MPGISKKDEQLIVYEATEEDLEEESDGEEDMFNIMKDDASFHDYNELIPHLIVSGV